MQNIPTNLTDLEIRDMLSTFGKVKNLRVLKDTRGHSKGYCFFEFEERDHTLVDVAIESLNQVDLGSKKLKVRRAVDGKRAPVIANTIKMLDSKPEDFINSIKVDRYIIKDEAEHPLALCNRPECHKKLKLS